LYIAENKLVVVTRGDRRRNQSVQSIAATVASCNRPIMRPSSGRTA